MNIFCNTYINILKKYIHIKYLKYFQDFGIALKVVIYKHKLTTLLPYYL